jgi:hypothetical protein
MASCLLQFRQRSLFVPYGFEHLNFTVNTISYIIKLNMTFTASLDLHMSHRELSSFELKSPTGTIDPELVGLLEPTTLNNSLEDLRYKYKRDGYLWIKNLIPREEVIEARRKYFQYLGPTGLTKEGSDAADGIFCGGDWGPVSRSRIL